MKASTIRETPFALCLFLVTFASRFIFWEKRTAGAPLAFCRFAVVPLRGGRPFYTTRKAARRALPSSVRLICRVFVTKWCTFGLPFGRKNDTKRCANAPPLFRPYRRPAACISTTETTRGVSCLRVGRRGGLFLLLCCILWLFARIRPKRGQKHAKNARKRGQMSFYFGVIY